MGNGNGQIAFLAAPREQPGFGICVLDLNNNADERCLTDFADRIGRLGLLWHPDGIHIITWDGIGADPGKYYSIDSISGERTELPQFRNLKTLALSADGNHVAYPDQDGQGFGVFAADFDGGNKRQIVHGTYSDISLSWSPDGQKLAFSARRGQVEDIYVVNRDGADMTNLTQSALRSDPLFTLSRPRWSPDGKQIAFDAFRAGLTYRAGKLPGPGSQAY